LHPAAKISKKTKASERWGREPQKRAQYEKASAKGGQAKYKSKNLTRELEKKAKVLIQEGRKRRNSWEKKGKIHGKKRGGESKKSLSRGESLCGNAIHSGGYGVYGRKKRGPKTNGKEREVEHSCAGSIPQKGKREKGGNKTDDAPNSCRKGVEGKGALKIKKSHRKKEILWREEGGQRKNLNVELSVEKLTKMGTVRIGKGSSRNVN